MYAKWIKETVSAGDFDKKKILIKKGEVRKIKTKKDGLFILEGKDGVGSFGWVNPEEIVLIESREYTKVDKIETIASTYKDDNELDTEALSSKYKSKNE